MDVFNFFEFKFHKPENVFHFTFTIGIIFLVWFIIGILASPSPLLLYIFILLNQNIFKYNI